MWKAEHWWETPAELSCTCAQTHTNFCKQCIHCKSLTNHLPFIILSERVFNHTALNNIHSVPVDLTLHCFCENLLERSNNGKLIAFFFFYFIYTENDAEGREWRFHLKPQMCSLMSWDLGTRSMSLLSNYLCHSLSAVLTLPQDFCICRRTWCQAGHKLLQCGVYFRFGSDGNHPT